MRYQNGLALSSAGLVIPAEGKDGKPVMKKKNSSPIKKPA
jgi:cell division protein FtsQ